ncbi:MULTISPECIES: 16S rRNA (cytosine(1402)-N(4))-methyltransferase RsmH [unclassified Hyphomicrobium]|uniref:16S rRNA (cytosine(1402)-N(4))-methyltransferase RsmH n=1 Tax=unclassified Hyphomicrobium TaxID=2619925 RepID=UPI000213F8D8|nr:MULTISPECIES: 16S rRNA (cytosine(1402)-N(4))-methyltransferase RsmH [unclassified Hyphomicrobium]CCB63562.1 S-adenosyl-dependent methyltransferase [Hyphomicrobium sp. MC1]
MTRGGGAEGASLGPADKHPRHIPVLISEVLETLAPKAGETYIDGTFGAGGYTRAILEKADCSVLALDRDPNAIRGAAPLIAQFGRRLKIIETPFSQMEDAVGAELPGQQVDGVVLDIGVSSMQLDDAERGFSFQSDGPLDMRMSSSGMSAADFLNTADEEDIANVIYEFGEEHRSRAIARAIVKRRVDAPFSRTLELADVVSRVFHGRKVDGRHPATRTFQALRIFVNDELGELTTGLAAAERILKPGGRLVVVSFHSLEDRIVKKFLTERSGKTAGASRHQPPELIKSADPSFRLVNSRPLTPSKGELEVNPRSRSARLRAAIRLDAAAWPLDTGATGLSQHRR